MRKRSNLYVHIVGLIGHLVANIRFLNRASYAYEGMHLNSRPTMSAIE